MATSRSRSAATASKGAQAPAAHRNRQQRNDIGRAVRDAVARSSHGEWKAARDRPDPVAVLEASSKGRLPELIPIRYGRMLRSPFTFLRGAAAVMAQDLAATPVTGFDVQACGDCHLLNFGLFATPERNLVFDLNDFDETLPGPWEWDLKRLCASVMVAGRDCGLSDAQALDAVREASRAYREHLRECAALTPMEVWYQRLDIQTIIDAAPDAKSREFREQLAKQARRRIIDHLFPKLATIEGGEIRLVDQPPLLFHPDEPDLHERMTAALREYRASLSDERRVLLDRYRAVDCALKVVGIGSVGTRCYVVLMVSDDNDPLILQVKEAGRSVLEPHLRKSVYANQGQRVVMGQRLMQSSSDIFLGWMRGKDGLDFHVRQLRDMKMSIPVEGFDAGQLARYARGCGWSLARAHAKTGDAASIAGYLGKSERMDETLGQFARIYADQTERDHALLAKAVRQGRVEAVVEA
ncbi:DUF2252 domain-containing protein [Niveibacterium sp. SC-1]|uniref:DUF2252 domain-containing protein n=1 Tax=Niveibacterium sp. SC-1 TaxID=3135646 RepID=UPI00311EED20